MSRGKKRIQKVDTALNGTNKGIQILVENSDKKKEKIDDIKSNTDILVKNSNSKLQTVIAIIGDVVAIIGVIVAIIGIIISNSKPISENTTNEPVMSTAPSSYAIYLYPEYKRLKVKAETDITASLNFETDSVNIDAYLNSVHNGDTVKLEQKNSLEWQAKIYFTETGVFEIIATATSPDGQIIEGRVEIEVLPQ